MPTGARRNEIISIFEQINYSRAQGQRPWIKSREELFPVIAKLAPWRLRRLQEHARSAAAPESTKIAFLADLCGVSASHLARSFRQTTGMTLRAYMESVRIDRARRLLAETEMPIKDVAGASGFSTARYFSSAFRRVAGDTPRDFRALAKAGRRSPVLDPRRGRLQGLDDRP
jgi:AraC family transcriptional regulator